MRLIREEGDLVPPKGVIRMAKGDYRLSGAIILDKYEYFRAWLSRGFRLLFLSSSSPAA